MPSNILQFQILETFSHVQVKNLKDMQYKYLDHCRMVLGVIPKPQCTILDYPSFFWHFICLCDQSIHAYFKLFIFPLSIGKLIQIDIHTFNFNHIQTLQIYVYLINISMECFFKKMHLWAIFFMHISSFVY